VEMNDVKSIGLARDFRKLQQVEQNRILAI
jgi:hypothetical protein